MAKVYLLTGLSGAGKTTLSMGIFERNKEGMPLLVIDGDEIRSSLSSDLGFQKADRIENLRRCGEIARIASRQGITVLLAMIAPYEIGRRMLRDILGDALEIIYVECPLEECKRRDVKGNYKKARMGELKNYTGIDDIYEAPGDATITVDTVKLTIQEAIEICATFIGRNGSHSL